MKDSRFIELVNLYIDRQASPEEAAELEFEIQGNVRRRQVYQQYCRMHRATKLVYESFRAAGESTAPAAGRQPATIEYIQGRQRQRRMRWVYGLSGLAAAACVAFVVMRAPNSQPTTTLASNPTVSAPVVAAVESPAAIAPKPVEIEIAPSVINRPALTREYATLMASLQDEPRTLILPSNSTQPQLQSLFDDGVFDAHTTVLPLRNRSQQNNRNQRTPTEFTAFQFQR